MICNRHTVNLQNHWKFHNTKILGGWNSRLFFNPDLIIPSTIFNIFKVKTEDSQSFNTTLLMVSLHAFNLQFTQRR